MLLTDRLQHAWNAFMNKDPTVYPSGATISSYRMDRPRFSRGNERTIVTAVYNRIAVDVAAISIEHVREDQNGSFVETIESRLNRALTISANIDQTGRALIQDLVMSMFDEGCVAVVPVETTFNPKSTTKFDIDVLRVGKIIQWYPEHVLVKLYNEQTGNKEDLLLPKKLVAIVENPFYSIMNEPNSVLQRLIRKLTLLDAVDEQTGSGKLDLIIQLPYVIKSTARREQAEARRKDIEMQLTGSKYGIAYTDGTERITQLNRSIDNQLLNQIEYLTKLLYSQLGLTEEIMNGTANEATMNNYYNRTIEPILTAITDEFKRKFLSKTAITQKQSIRYLRDPFKLVPTSQLADFADKFTRNEILSSNEVRAIVGRKPSNDPAANELRNKNLNESNNTASQPATVGDTTNDPTSEGEQALRKRFGF